jgi:hypothetical protein
MFVRFPGDFWWLRKNSEEAAKEGCWGFGAFFSVQKKGDFTN